MRMSLKGRGAAIALGLAVIGTSITLATPASATHWPPPGEGRIINHTGRTLVGLTGFDHGKGCTVWNWGEVEHKRQSYRKHCDRDHIDPHTATSRFDDFDAVTVQSSGYFWVNFEDNGSWYKVPAHYYVQFGGRYNADCYSGPHVTCKIHKVW
ncbi:hypothetical protein [Streptomyces sp. NPDC088727]|uniref:hypothetical protein n=1 Tax=Streptomyces sp. NPDC088727 TaxID=3365875 RepID=UPI003816AC12